MYIYKKLLYKTQYIWKCKPNQSINFVLKSVKNKKKHFFFYNFCMSVSLVIGMDNVRFSHVIIDFVVKLHAR